MDRPNVPSLPKTLPATFLQEVLGELKKVTWPTREETIKLTATVIILSLAVGAFIGGLDILFVNITTLIFKK
jgi:preprotein translocase subunit SecE